MYTWNAGTKNIAENIDIKIDDFKSIKNFCLKSRIELLIVGPEQPLVDGIVDYFRDTNIYVFGPNKLASKLEGSKIFTKELCEKIIYLLQNLIYSKISKPLNCH